MTKLEKMAVDVSRSREVEALCRLHGMSVTAACKLSGIRPQEYKEPPRARLDHLPSPKCIDRMTLAIRDGFEYVSESSFDRWQEMRLMIATTAEIEADPDDFDLGGRITDDAAELPAWLYSGGWPD